MKSLKQIEADEAKIKLDMSKSKALMVANRQSKHYKTQLFLNTVSINEVIADLTANLPPPETIPQSEMERFLTEMIHSTMHYPVRNKPPTRKASNDDNHIESKSPSSSMRGG